MRRARWIGATLTLALVLGAAADSQAQASKTRRVLPNQTNSTPAPAATAPAAPAAPAPATTSATTQPAQTGADQGPGNRGGGPGGLNTLSRLRDMAVGLGGGGGGRGGRGGNGGSTVNPRNIESDLLNITSVQDELGLTESQKAKLTEIIQQGREQMRAQFQQMRQANQGNQAGQQGPGGRGGRGGFDPTMMAAMAALQQSQTAEMAKLLTPEQRKRLSEIAYQVAGPLAIATRAELAKALNLSPMQLDSLAEIVAQIQAAQQQVRSSMRDMFAAQRGAGAGGNFGFPGGAAANGGARGNRGAGGTPPGTGTPAAAGARNPGVAAGPGAAGGPGQADNREQFRALTEQMNAQMDNVRAQAIAQISRNLTRTQKNAYAKILGKAFDLESLNAAPANGFGGFRGTNANANNPQGGTGQGRGTGQVGPNGFGGFQNLNRPGQGNPSSGTTTSPETVQE